MQKIISYIVLVGVIMNLLFPFFIQGAYASYVNNIGIEGDFEINNDNISTGNFGVTLNMSMTGAVNMRFGNTIAERDSAIWEAYASTKNWTLSGPNETKVVYAEFENASGDTLYVQDDIILESLPYDTGLSLWLDASEVSTVTASGGNIGQWNDKSGNNYHAIQSVQNNQATQLEDEINFNGTSDYFYLDNINYQNTVPLDGLFVCSVFSTTNDTTSISGNWSYLDFDRSEWFNFYNRGANIGFSYDSNGTIRDLTSAGYTINDGELHVSCASYDNTKTTDTTITIDGNVAYSGDVEPLGAQIGVGQSTRYGFVGDGSEANSENGARNNVYYEGGMNEIVYFDSAVSLVDQKDVECYLGKKWGVTIAGCPIIDLAPIASVDYTPEISTTGSVVGSITNESEAITILNNGGSASYEFTLNESFTFEFEDATGNRGSVTATVDWIENSPPTDINLSNNEIDENSLSATIIGTFSSVDVNSTDTHSYALVSGTGSDDNADFTLTQSTLSVNASPDFETQSSYSIRVQSDDGNGGTFEEIFTIIVNDIDEIPPVTTLTGSGIINLIKNNSYNELGATCTDDIDSTCIVNVSGASVDTATLGTYVIQYDATDNAGNAAVQVSRTVNVVTGDVPVITLSGSVSETVEVLSSYVDAGATAVDVEDGDISGDISIVNPVDTSAIGTYSVTYDVSDSSDNDAIQVIRTVNVVDTTPPVLTLTGTGVVNIIKNSTYTDAGALASDAFEGNITVDIITVNPVDTSTLGTYTITYNVSDSSGNAAAQVSRTVNVIPGDVPVITLSGSVSETVEVLSSYVDAGATATDTEDGNISGDVVVVDGVNTSATGSYTVTYNVTDSSDNDAIQVVRTVNVVDTTAPVISLVGSDPVHLTQGDSYTDAGATCSDNFDISCSVVVGGDIVDTTRVGSYTIEYDAVDITGNNASQVTRTVHVAAADILINEVEYDTSGNESESEWFELYNPTSGIVNIENWTITEKVGSSSNKSYTFGDVDIPAGGYIVITNETTDFQDIYPAITPDVDLPGVSFFALKNSPDDELELKDPLGVSIDYVSWENTAAGWDLFAPAGFPICRLLVADSDSVADWSDECVATPQSQNSFNAIPADITLSSEDIDENNAAGAIVASLTTSDTDSGDTHTYSLAVGAGDVDNASFSISGDSLQITPVADYETQQSYNIRIATNDGKGGVYSEAFTIDINNINLAPTDITLTNQNIDENNTLGDTIGVLGGLDDGEDTNTLDYSLACSTPGADDGSFAISGTNLNAAGIYDFETKDEYNICIRVSDGALSYDENFTIDINDLDEVAPVVVITAVTKLQNSSITDTTIRVTDDVAVNAADISIGTGSTATASALNCTQTSSTQVDCTISIDTTGDFIIEALDTSANLGSDTETNYVIDTVAPNIPSVSVDTESPFNIDSPELTFSSLDNVGVDHYEVTYYADDGGAGTGTLTTIDPATSPVVLSLDPHELPVHTIIVTVYDVAGNSSSTTIKFPPIITIDASTTLSNSTITDSTVTISAPTGNNLTNIVLIPNTTGASLGTCTGDDGGNTDPYATPVTCIINNISASGSLSVTAEDAGNGAQGLNSQSYVIDTEVPVISITAPNKLDNTSITNTTIAIIDETGINISDVTIDGASTATYSAFSCIQTSPLRVDCTIQIDDSGDLVISADDLAGNNTTETELNYIIDDNPPVLSLVTPSPETVEYLSVYTDGGALYTDDVDGTGSLLGFGSVNTGILGNYTLDYNYTDTAGNTGATVTRTVSVVDTTSPVISLIGTGVTIEVHSTYNDAGATALDNYDGDITGGILSTGSVDTSNIGIYTIYYDVTDSNGNVATQVTRNVEVVDTTLPIISLIGSDEIILEVGSSYSELGATVTDNLDVITPASISIGSGSLDINTVGSYSVTYNVSDNSGNNAEEVIRTIIVRDTTNPVITLTGTGETIEVGTPYADLGATATDNYDGNITGNISVLNPVDTSIVGTYIVRYDVLDSSGNAATQITRTVQVVDTTIPVITLVGTGVIVEANTSYTDAGATALDNFDGDITPNISINNTVNITEIGTYSVTYDVIDSNGNAATQISRSVEVVDTTSPVISLIGSSSLTLIKNAVYTEFGAICSDNYDTTCNVTIAGDSVDTTTLGTYTVTYNVSDAAGNIASQVTRIVEVVTGDIPVLSLVGSGTITVEVNTNYLDEGATASDSEDGNISSSIVINNAVDITEIGVYSVTYDITDSSDNVASQISRSVNVVDTTAPNILLTGTGNITLFRNAVYTEFGAICSDNYDTTCNVTIAGDSVDTTTLGTYTVTYDASDSQGNTATQVTRIVEVIAGDIPVITLTGSGTINHEVNTAYTDLGATASDSEDGDLSSSIVTVNPMNSNILGSYIVSYDVTDFSGNTATGVTRTVNVVDTTAPVIALTGSASIDIVKNSSYTELGATCSDNFDTSCSVSIAGDVVDTSILGSYSVRYNSTDSSNNSSLELTRIVHVIPGNIPVININGPSTINHEVGVFYSDAGATAIDVEDGNISSDIVTTSLVSVNALGTYSVNYDVVDSSDNSATQVTRIVNVVDTTAPNISLSGSTTEIVSIGNTYTDAGVICSDNYDISCNVIVSNSVDENTLGTYSVTYNVTDSSGNAANQITRSVIVVDNSTDSDGDGVPDEIEILIGTNPTLTDSDGNGENDLNNDLDSISPLVELGAGNSGDGNGDNILDAIQGTVASIPNIENTSFNTLEISNALSTSCNQVGKFESKRESSLGQTEQGFVYDLGLWDFEIGCDAAGETVDIEIYLDRLYDTSQWEYRKYSESSETYTDISSIVSYSTQTLSPSGEEVTVISYSITDGGIYDEDGLANGTIVDPSGPAVVNTGGIGGGRTYSCRDESALNYRTFGFSDPTLCEYEDTIVSVIPEQVQGTQEEDIKQDSTKEIDQGDNIVEEIIEDDNNVELVKDMDYTVENNFDSCSVIGDIQDVDYIYSGGKYTDTALSRYESEINKFSQIGIVNGYPDGSFAPDKEMTRTEFLKVALISHCYEYQNEDTSSLIYADVEKDSWQARVISKAQSLGMIHGDVDEDGESIFRPNDIISKAEAVKILMNLSFIAPHAPVSLGYKDITTSWHEKYVITGETLGLFDAVKTDFLFFPDNGVKREDMIDLINSLVKLY